MRTDTKLEEIREAMRLEDWKTALGIARKFKRLGPESKAIRGAADALQNPQFYEQLGKDVDAIVAAGVEALKRRFSKSWEAVAAEGEDPDAKDE